MKELILNILPVNDREDMPVWQYVIKKILAFFLCLYGAGIVCEVIVIAVLTAMGHDPLHGDMPDETVMELIMYYGYIVVVALILLVYWKLVEKKTIEEIGFDKRSDRFVTGGFAAIVLLGISVTLIVLTGAIKYNGIFPDIDVPMILLYFGGFICQGIYEEVLCRGVLLQTLRRKLPLPWAVIVSSLPFIILHLSSMSEGGIYAVLGIANLFAVSVVFAMLTVRTKGLWAACGLHSIWNFALYSILGLNVSGNDGGTAAVFDLTTAESSILNGGEYGIEASVITLGVLTAFAVVLVITEKKEVDILR